MTCSPKATGPDEYATPDAPEGDRPADSDRPATDRRPVGADLGSLGRRPYPRRDAPPSGRRSRSWRWTFLVWTTRIANIWRDADLDTGERWGRTVLALSFTVLAVAVAVALWRRLATGPVVAVGALAAWTIAVWVVRDIGILAADHDLGFKVVHTVLAVVSIVLAVLAWRETRRETRREAARPATPAPVPAERRG